jgi:flavin-dependent dehydrogenase
MPDSQRYSFFMSRRIKTVAIIGGGPAGASLGALLAQNGYTAAIFHTDKRPPLIVGESLLPVVIPMLQRLGIEEEVKSFSVYKPGATVCLSLSELVQISFRWAGRRMASYAYNTPRDLFDGAVLKSAEKAGAKILRMPAKLERGTEPDTVRLTDETLQKTDGFFKQQPDLIVDATGRLRTISRLLDIPVTEGGRKDIAMFAHLDKAVITDPGNIHLDYLTHGWSWRIPLPGRVSVGVVINPSHLEKFGGDIEQQYDAFIREEPSLRVYTEGAKRLTPVVKYNNYQIVPMRLHGNGWAMIGDAAGFLDPVFSSGVFLSMQSAFGLFEAIEAGSEAAVQKFQERRYRELEMWRRVIESWYSGTLFNMYRAGQKWKNNPLGSIVSRRVQWRLAGIFGGQTAADAFSMKVFDYLNLFGTLVRDPKDLVVN